MHDKTIVFIGDSLGRQQFHVDLRSQKLKMLNGNMVLQKNAELFVLTDGLTDFQKPIRPSYIISQLMRFRAKLLNITDPLTNVSFDLDRPPAFMRNFLHRFDLMFWLLIQHTTGTRGRLMQTGGNCMLMENQMKTNIF